MTQTKVAVVKASNVKDLQDEVNRECRNKWVKDIKYEVRNMYNSVYVEYSAMIIYEGVEAV